MTIRRWLLDKLLDDDDEFYIYKNMYKYEATTKRYIRIYDYCYYFISRGIRFYIIVNGFFCSSAHTYLQLY